MIKQHRFIAAFVLMLSAQFLLVAPSAAGTWSYNGAVSLTGSSYNVPKTAGSVTIVAVRNGGHHGAMSVSYKTVNETALAGAQFTAVTGTLTWADGDGASKTFRIPILNSAAFTTGTKWFSVRLTAGTGALLGSPNNANVNIAASSAAGTWSYNGAVSLASSSYNVAGTAGSVTMTAVRSGGRHGAMAVNYGTVSETALAGAQFTAVTGTLTWADGDGANKTFTIPILHSTAFTGTKWFSVRLAAGSGALLGSPSNANVTIAGGSTATTTVTKSIRAWVSCSETIDESGQLAAALDSAANHAFTLIIDCPVRFHTGSAAQRSIVVPDGVTMSFQGAGELLMVNSGPPALTVAHPAEVSFVNWNLTYL